MDGNGSLIAGSLFLFPGCQLSFSTAGWMCKKKDGAAEPAAWFRMDRREYEKRGSPFCLGLAVLSCDMV